MFAYKSITLCWFRNLFQILISDSNLLVCMELQIGVNKGMRGQNCLCVGGSPLNVSTRELFTVCGPIPAWRLWAMSSWVGRLSCGWEKTWSRAERCSCAGSGRCQPPPPTSQSRPRACWYRPNAGSLLQSCCWSEKQKTKTTSLYNQSIN